MTLGEVLYIIATFLLGSLPFSVWIGRLALQKDIRSYGDGNPGTFNVIRAGGLGWGALALILDICKSAVPVGLAAYIFDITGLPLVLISVAAPFGHAFSPFLGFKGGKALASIAGTWIGLTLMEVFLVGIIMLTYWYFALVASGWAVMFASASMLVYMLLTAAPMLWFAVWVILTLLAIYKHREELRTLPRFRMTPLLRPLFRSLEL
ncbi:MAG: glycerol-3-phosphate 1-O-acyltransferase PlsY [Anaerolineae bacterium]